MCGKLENARMTEIMCHHFRHLIVSILSDIHMSSHALNIRSFLVCKSITQVFPGLHSRFLSGVCLLSISLCVGVNGRVQ